MSSTLAAEGVGQEPPDGGLGEPGHRRREHAEHDQRARVPSGRPSSPVGGTPAPGRRRPRPGCRRPAGRWRPGRSGRRRVEQRDHAGVGQPDRQRGQSGWASASPAPTSRTSVIGSPERSGAASTRPTASAATPSGHRAGRQRHAARGRRRRAPSPAGRSRAALSTATVGRRRGGGGVQPGRDGDPGAQRGEQPAPGQHRAAYDAADAVERGPRGRSMPRP